MKIKLGVLFGGETVEHEVSIISAIQAMENMNADKYDIIPIYISKERIWYTGKMLMDMDFYKNFNDLKKYAKKVALVKQEDGFVLKSTSGLFQKDISEIDIVFPIVHGNNVEDGTIAGYLDSIGIPYVGSKVLGASLGQDKVVMKQIFKDVNLPVVDYTWFFDVDYYNDSDNIKKNIKKIGYPVVVKPATLGSSVGITYVKSEEQIIAAIEEAIKYDNKIIVEKAVNNLLEVNCSVVGNYIHQEASVIEEVITDDDILTYADKYTGGSKGKTGSKTIGSKGMASASRIIPARISKDMTAKIQEISKQAFKALNLSGICRIDYLIDRETNEVYINEPNTIPGSLAFYLWEATGKKYTDLLDDVIQMAIKDYKNKQKKIASFETNILSSYNNLKGGVKK